MRYCRTCGAHVTEPHDCPLRDTTPERRAAEKQRLERVATAVLGGLMPSESERLQDSFNGYELIARRKRIDAAIEEAKALIAELDKEPTDA